MDRDVGSGSKQQEASLSISEILSGLRESGFGISLGLGFPGGSDGKESVCNAGDLGLIPGSGRSPGERHGNPLQYLAWRIPKDRGAWRVTVHGIAESDAYMTEHLTLQPLVSPTEGGHHLVLSGL